MDPFDFGPLAFDYWAPFGFAPLAFDYWAPFGFGPLAFDYWAPSDFGPLAFDYWAPSGFAPLAFDCWALPFGYFGQACVGGLAESYYGVAFDLHPQTSYCPHPSFDFPLEDPSYLPHP